MLTLIFVSLIPYRDRMIMSDSYFHDEHILAISGLAIPVSMAFEILKVLKFEPWHLYRPRAFNVFICHLAGAVWANIKEKE